MVEPREIEVVCIGKCASCAPGSAKFFVGYRTPLTARAVITHRRTGWHVQKSRCYGKLEQSQRKADQEERQAVEERLCFVKHFLSGNLPKRLCAMASYAMQRNAALPQFAATAKVAAHLVVICRCL